MVKDSIWPWRTTVCAKVDEQLRCGRYWNDPDVLRKLGSAMGDMPVPGTATANGHAAPADEEQAAEEDGEEEEATVHSAASTGVLIRRAMYLEP
jgi:hypothetical protein